MTTTIVHLRQGMPSHGGSWRDSWGLNREKWGISGRGEENSRKENKKRVEISYRKPSSDELEQ